MEQNESPERQLENKCSAERWKYTTIIPNEIARIMYKPIEDWQSEAIEELFIDLANKYLKLFTERELEEFERTHGRTNPDEQ